MRFRKNEISLVVWIVYLIMIGVLMIFSGMTMKNELEVPLWLFLISCGGGLALLGLLFFLSDGLTTALEEDYSEGQLNFDKAEKGLIVLAFLGVVGSRVYEFLRIKEFSVCYEIAKVTEQGNGVLEAAGGHIKMVHGSTAMYLSMLHGLLKITNNSYEAAAVLQMILQLAGLGILFWGIRKMTGRLCSDLFLILNAFLPYSARMAVECTPDALYSVFFGMGLLTVCWFLSNVAKVRRKEWNIASFFVCGAAIGVVTYLDFAGLCLLLIAACSLNILVGDEDDAVNKGPFFTVAFSMVVSFFACIFIDAVLSGDSFGNVLEATFANYVTTKINPSVLYQDGEISFWVVFALCCLGIFTYMKRKDDDVLSVWIVALAGITLMKMIHLCTDYQDNSYLFFLLLTVVAAVSVSELFYAPCFEEKPLEEEDEIDLMEVMNLETVPAMAKEKLSGLKINRPKKDSEVPGRKNSEMETSEKKAFEEGTSEKDMSEKDTLEKEVPEKKERKYIKNPLPVPKKKERKGLEYPLEVSEENMKFDIEVAEDDDYDLKDD